jgi:membrane protease YdiL (CAAX protease family)
MQTSQILIYIFCYAMVFILSLISKKESSQRLIKDDGIISDKPGNIIGLHIIGILWLGIVPAIVLQQPVLKTLTGNSFPDNLVLLILLLLLLLTAAMLIKTGATIQQQFADSKHHHYQLPITFIIRYFIIRIIFLFVYELWFRGYLLFDSIDAMGIPLAVTLNVILHVLLHLYNSKKEMLGCILFSLLACWLCILCNAAWPAVILHIMFSLVYEINLYKSNFSTPKIARL